MKNRGLQNRFPPGTLDKWDSHDECMVCEKNCWDTLHHILSPSSRLYVRGDHNKSVLNSAPIHNFAHPIDMENMGDKHYCHFGNETALLKKEMIVHLLQKTIRSLLRHGYVLNDRDEQFLKIYSALYLVEDSYAIDLNRAFGVKIMPRSLLISGGIA